MKSKYKFLLIIPMMVLFSSCGNNWLELEPSTSVPTGTSITTLRDAQASITGVYSHFRNHEYYGSRMIYYADARGDDMRANGSTKRVAGAYIYKFTVESVPTAYWGRPYKVIRNANSILAQIDKLEVESEEDISTKDYIKGQALTFRAIAHFDLARLFGTPYLKDNGASLGAVVELKVAPTNYRPTRNTVKECYDAAIKDLIEAIPLMKSNANETQAYLNKSSSQLILSRIYLYSGRYQEAYDMAKSVIDGASAAGFKLWTKEEYVSQTIWKTKMRSEALFELAYGSTDQAPNDGIAFLMNDKSDGYDDIIFTNSFLDAFAAKDIRKASIMKKVGKKYYCIKFAGEGKVRDANVMIFRLSEAYLIAAEASVHIADQVVKDQGRSYYNVIHTRAGLEEVTTDLTIEQVLQERRFELAGEGHRMFDLLRNNMKIERIGSDHLSDIGEHYNNKTIDWNNYLTVLPIPKAEINANSNILPNNPGY